MGIGKDTGKSDKLKYLFMHDNNNVVL